MRMKSLTILGLSIFLLASISSYAQEISVSQRESLWAGLKLPSPPFVRRTNVRRSKSTRKMEMVIIIGRVRSRD